MNKPDFRLDIC